VHSERSWWVFGTTAPALVFLLVIAYLPIAYAVMLSFFKKTAFNPAMKWVGLANYRYILEEPELWNAFWRSVVFTLGAVGLQLVWGLVAALLGALERRGPDQSGSAESDPAFNPVNESRTKRGRIADSAGIRIRSVYGDERRVRHSRHFRSVGRTGG